MAENQKDSQWRKRISELFKSIRTLEEELSELYKDLSEEHKKLEEIFKTTGYRPGPSGRYEEIESDISYTEAKLRYYKDKVSRESRGVGEKEKTSTEDEAEDR